MQPENMTVVLTGACGGIGQILAYRLASAGANLYLCGRDAEALDRLQQNLTDLAAPNQTIEASVVDLTDDVVVDAWLQSFTLPVNVLINNAGICRFDLFDRFSDSDIENIMNLNATVPMKLTRKLLPGLKQQPEARVINIGSTFGAIGFPGYAVYSASKHAIRGFSQSLRRELADTGIQVGCILPRATQTGINSDRVVELNRRLKVTMDPPETVAEAVVDFACNNRGEIALGWPEKILVRLNSVFPALIGNAISKKLPLIKQYAA